MERATETSDSVYPDLLQTGLAKLGQLDARRELLALFSALEHFRRDLHTQDSVAGILKLCHRYVVGLGLFEAAGYWLVNSADLGFEPALISPETVQERLTQVVRREIRGGRFAWALRHSSPVFFQAGAGSEEGAGAAGSSAALRPQD